MLYAPRASLHIRVIFLTCSPFFIISAYPSLFPFSFSFRTTHVTTVIILSFYNCFIFIISTCYTCYYIIIFNSYINTHYVSGLTASLLCTRSPFLITLITFYVNTSQYNTHVVFVKSYKYETIVTLNSDCIQKPTVNIVLFYG